MSERPASRASVLAGWLLGLVAGALGGVLTLSWAVPVPGLGLLPLAVGMLAPPRPFGAAGTLLGWGATWAALLLRADAACDPSSCQGPDISPWLVASAILVVAAIGLLAVGIVRSGAQHD
jgi:hypothetical protein